MSALRLFEEPAAEARPLRPHQRDAITALKTSLLAGNKRVVIQLPTGAGKTRTAAEIVLGALGKGNRVCFTVPRISLVDQTVAAFENEGIDWLGVVQASHPRTDYGAPVQIASVDSLRERACPDVGMVIVDECHLGSVVIDRWMEREPRKVFVGLSATPWRRGMAERWQDLVSPVSMQQLIDAGFLSPFRVFAPSHPDMSGVKTGASGDYQEEGSAEVMGGLVADVVETWIKRAERRPTLVFAVNLAHARQLQQQFAAAGVAMGYCEAKTDLVERKLQFDRLARGEIAGIVNVGTLTTGVDADVRCIVLARPTKSEMLHVQIIGRGLRTASGKADCLILDHADNHARLGFVTDIHHDKLLAGKDRNSTRKEQGEPMPKECGSCGILKPPRVRECPACGFAPERQSDIEVEDGELLEIAPSKGPKPKPADKQRLWSELLDVARVRNRSRGWASHAYRERMGVWPRALADVCAPASPETLSWVRAKDIRFAKSREARR